jgi:hypothetical protein
MKVEFYWDPVYYRLTFRLHLGRIYLGLQRAYDYTLPRFTFRDHLKDCFGWLVYKPQPNYDEFCEAFLDALENSMPFLRGLLR